MRKMNRVLLLMLLAFNTMAMACTTTTNKELNTNPDSVKEKTTAGKVVKIDQAMFKKLVWDYQNSPQEWKFTGERPVVVDFYADWCGPCRRVAPIMEKLAEEFKGQIDIYKVNVDHNKELSAVFGINSIPAILFVPMNEKPAMQPGLMQEEQYRQIFKEFVLGIKANNTTNNKE